VGGDSGAKKNPENPAPMENFFPPGGKRGQPAAVAAAGRQGGPGQHRFFLSLEDTSCASSVWDRVAV